MNRLNRIEPYGHILTVKTTKRISDLVLFFYS